jgi:arginyl-tRNA synthetase
LEREVKKRHRDWDDERKKKAIKNIFSAAIKFDMLHQDPNKNIVFDISKSLDFEGETGPYIQYTHARISSIFKKYEETTKKKYKFDLKTIDLINLENEGTLLKLLYRFPTVISEAADSFKPSAITRYLISLSQTFNEFYHSRNILKEKTDIRDARLGLCFAVKKVISTGLKLLAIEVPDEM